MSYLDDYEENRLTIETSGFSEQAVYLIEHFLYTNDSSRQQSETSRGKIAGVVANVVNDPSYGTFLVGKDVNNNVILENLGRPNNTIILDVSDNGAIRIPVGTSTERPINPREGYFRINTTEEKVEVYINNNWENILNFPQTDQFVRGYVDPLLVDLSNVLHTKINVDISNVIGGAGEALDTLKELEDFVTDLSGSTVTDLVSKVVDLSAREQGHYTQVSSNIVSLNTYTDNIVDDLSSITFHTLNTEISDLSSDTSREISNTLSDISGYTSMNYH